ncbi:MAG: ribonuclease HII [Smithellaceae bacterium]|nr:ribonuclease HII [Smithellaceae bacterium]
MRASNGQAMYNFERNARRRGYRLIAGIDEAGRGPLAGPVVAAAVILPSGYKNPEINDSKQLSPQRRDHLYGVISEDALSVGIGVIEPSVIDEVNILQAALMAMREAVLNLSSCPDYLLIDGTSFVALEIPQERIVKGDCRSVSIAAASIVAKVSRDRIMEIYHRQFPQYNFIKNKGYGTAEHRDALRDYGYCKLHRRSFQFKDEAVYATAELEFI